MRCLLHQVHVLLGQILGDVIEQGCQSRIDAGILTASYPGRPNFGWK